MSEFDSEPRAQRLCPPLRRRAAGAGRDIIEEDRKDMKKNSSTIALLLMNGSPYWISYALLGRKERTYLKLVRKERTGPTPNEPPASL